jgi:hypothetical protein
MASTKYIIEKMLQEIQNYKRKKEDLLPMYVQERINKQIQTYYKQIMDSYSTLTHQQNEIKVAKKLNKEI